MPTKSLDYKIKKPGWYLLSGISGESVHQTIQNYYKMYTYLDISRAYVPLSKDIKNIQGTQELFNHRANMCSLAAKGKWSKELEKK